MPVTSFALGPLETNCYLVYNGSTAVAVDVGGDPAPILKFLADNGLTLSHILITHCHFDHLYGVSALQTATKAATFAPAADDCLKSSTVGKGGQWGLPLVPEYISEATPLGNQTFGDFEVTVIETPGHTPGSVSLFFPSENTVFTGDALFYRSVGRSDFPGGDHEALIRGIRERLFSLPDDVVVCPGHGPGTTIGAERAGNPQCGDFAVGC